MMLCLGLSHIHHSILDYERVGAYEPYFPIKPAGLMPYSPVISLSMDMYLAIVEHDSKSCTEYVTLTFSNFSVEF